MRYNVPEMIRVGDVGRLDYGSGKKIEMGRFTKC